MTGYHFIQAYNAQEENAAHFLIPGKDGAACAQKLSEAVGDGYVPFLIEPIRQALDDIIACAVEAGLTSWTPAALNSFRNEVHTYALDIVFRTHVSGAIALRPYTKPAECCPPETMLAGYLERQNEEGRIELSGDDVLDFVICQMRDVIDGECERILEGGRQN
ncbi:hypothetical protein FJZ28_00395 [Candidatus Peregrinibacteria bacterium]|nr:hypothetical protein [Candidatus Peregrinibacteria bacterium]